MSLSVTCHQKNLPNTIAMLLKTVNTKFFLLVQISQKLHSLLLRLFHPMSDRMPN